ncbi:MAG TPA: YegS/Rv2252/BmrU family lipid kinase [Sphingomonas sp.]|nr:YegS/Rv2252/BmrU family lipid kinase [Sphingomonas sp.]
MTIRTATMIVNAQSRKGRDQFAEACAALERLPFAVDAHAVRDPAELDATMKRALAAKPDLMILGGGDGTISGLVDALVGTDTALAVLPLGTANSFARSLGIPLDIAGAVEVIASGRLKRIDLGMIDQDYFANCAAIGISPQIAETVPHGLKRILGRVGYMGWAALEYARFRPFTLIVDDGRAEKRLRALEVRISNGSFQGGTEVVDAARVDSGEIVVQAVTGPFKRRLLRNWAASMLRLDARHDDTVEFSGTSLHVATEPPLPISIDGEVLAKTPVTAHVAAGAIRVMVPA